MSEGTYVTRYIVGEYRLWKGIPPFLSHLDIELTERCNNNCMHCNINLPADDLDSKKKELSTNQIKEILKQATSLGCRSARFTGGEPLLRKDFEELYIFARRLGLQVMVFTNATLITTRLAKLFKRIPPLENIEITFYGMKKSTYEAVTREPGSFEAARRGINLLLQHQVPFLVKGVFLPANKGEIDEFNAWASAVSWMNDPPSYATFFDLHCRRDEEKNRLIRSIRISPKEGLKLVAKGNESYFKEMKKFCSKFMGPPGDKLLLCEACIFTACVDAYGILQPCMLLRHPACVYDLKKGTVKDAMENFFPKIIEKKAVNQRYLTRCAKCFLKGLCAQCPAKSWMEHGTLDTPVEYLCEIAHTQARFLGLLKDNETAWEVTDWKERTKNFTEGDDYGNKGKF